MINLSRPRSQPVIMSVRDAIAAPRRAIAKAEERLILLRNLEGCLKENDLRLRERDKGIVS